MSGTATEIVTRLCDSFADGDIEAVMRQIAPDCVYANVPLPAMTGHDEIRAFLAPALAQATKLEFVMKAIAEAPDGRTVLTERVDIFNYAESVVEAPVMGIFVVRDGLIAEWRDYSDIASFVSQMGALGKMPSVTA